METKESVNSEAIELREISITNWLFFFVLSYFFLYCNVGQFLTSFLFEWIYTILVPPFASLLGEENLTRVTRTGSGDTPFNYYQVFFMMFVAFVASFPLLFLMRKDKTAQTFLKIVYMLVRYYIIYQMIIYGLSKIFYLQFQSPKDYRLESTLGDMSPMGLMWTFMGYSKGYTMFAGWMEFLAGIFVLFRRTTILGAIMTFGVMLNVFMMNMCYDVPVKLLSFHMTIMGLFLLVPIWKEVFAFFFSREKVNRSTIPFFEYGAAKLPMFWLKVMLLLVMVIRLSSNYYDSYQNRNATNVFTKKHNIIDHKIYTDSLQLIEPDDGHKWKSVIAPSSKMLRVQLENDQIRWLDVVFDEETQSVKVKKSAEVEYKTLKYTVDSSGVYHLIGRFSNDSLSIKMKESDDDFLLRTREFHWMQDYPFNR